jgi:aminoglycoside phosphotransferase (APT) family kinase protein
MPFDRSQIDEALVRRLVDSQFPHWSGLPVRSVEVDGWDNRTFRLGEELSVRLPTGDWYAKQVAKEQRWLPVLAPQLPVPIPSPVAQGAPESGYPFPWSVYRWLDGTLASQAPIGGGVRFATDVARFLTALGRCDATGGPEPGEHNFFRGAPLATYEAEALEALESLDGPRDAVLRVWEDAMSTRWERDPVWLHGDVAVNNLLVRDGRLAAVLDFGSSGVGDPACDVVLAFTFLRGAARDAFRRSLGVDAGMWSRGRGWALWKALITGDRATIEQVLADYGR